MEETSESFLQNRTFDEIKIGDSARLTRNLTVEDIQLFAAISGDLNPTHIDAEFAHASQFREVVGHSLWGGVLISAILGNELPGPGTVYVSQVINFARPVTAGDTLTVTVTVREKNEQNHHIIFDCVAVSQDGTKVLDGRSEVAAPTEKIRRPRVSLPKITISDRETRYRRLLSLTAGLAPIPIAVAYPCDADSLRGPLQAAEAGLVTPILVGPEKKIRSLAEAHSLDIKGLRIVNAESDREAARAAVGLCRDEGVEALMKGSLHTDHLMSAVVSKDGGLRTSRRISHVFLADVPTYPRLLLITDAAVNIEPSLEEKADIIQNAIELGQILGAPEPKVAILAAVETINPRMRSTLEAAALCKMADRGQIKGGLLDGPLAFDNAVSPRAVQIKGIKSLVAGQADILAVPNLEAGNMIAKQLEYLAGALMGGIVLGARVPIVLTSRADTAQTRAVSCVVAQLMAHRRREAK
jgi:phosphate acetyltransferase